MSPASSSIRSVDDGRRPAGRVHHALLDERDHARVRIVGEQAPHEAAADEAREPGDEETLTKGREGGDL